MIKYILFAIPFFSWGQNLLFIPDTLSGLLIPLEINHNHMHFFPGTETETMGINGPILGPTVILNKGQQVTMQVTNVTMDSTTMHWHGLHVPPEDDGGPHTPITPFSVWSPSFEVMDKAGTYWYHPHLHHMTNMHVQKGVAGMIIVRDNEEANLNLPRTYGVDDIPIIIQTKGFDSNNQIVVETALDTTLMVNATIDPYVQLPEQIVRLRLLNGSSERVYNLGLSNGNSFHLIATDGGLLNTPVNLSRLKLAPGERAEILVNLQGLLNQTISLMSYGTQLPSGTYGAGQPGMGPGQSIPNYTLNPLNGANFEILQIQVIAATSNAVLSIPTSLSQNTPWTENSANATKTLTFSPQVMGQSAIVGPFLINNTTFDMDVINYQIPLNNIEIWTLQNNTPIAHPFHLHNVPFYILDINGVTPPPELAGRKDVVLVPGGQGTVRFITKFEDFANDSIPYMYHCHMLTHEDGGMMGQYVVFDPLNNIIELNDDLVTIFPNPSNELIQFTTEKEISQIKILSMDGQLLFQENKPSNNHLTINNFNKGMYTIEFIMVNQKVIRKNFVKL
jgi:bilirubin oxidase